MSNDELTAIVDAARARQADITPAPWVLREWDERQNHNLTSHWEISGVMDFADNGVISCPDDSDANLITDAPALQALAIAQVTIIERQAARIAELEAQQMTIPTPRIHVYEGNTIAHGKRWFYSVHIGNVGVSNNHSAPTEAEAYECAYKAVEYYLNRLTGKSSEWGGY